MNWRLSGFTLLEILLVFAITIVMALLTIPAAVNYLNLQSMDEASTNLLVDLRRMRDQAQAGKNDADWGIRQFGTFYVLFEGPSYAARDAAEDTTVNLESGLTINGPAELVFSKLTGNASTTTVAILTISRDLISIPIYVDYLGKIEK